MHLFKRKPASKRHSTPIPSSFKCPHCELSFSSQISLNSHAIQHELILEPQSVSLLDDIMDSLGSLDVAENHDYAFAENNSPNSKSNSVYKTFKLVNDDPPHTRSSRSSKISSPSMITKSTSSTSTYHSNDGRDRNSIRDFLGKSSIDGDGHLDILRLIQMDAARGKFCWFFFYFKKRPQFF